ncbi:MAG: CHAP domain-containing protein [Candidatus Eremiobacteraeota bacterium]|nr:CHAP domain-containing protein [Candidatus Eremiobacteraeota bacterium]
MNAARLSLATMTLAVFAALTITARPAQASRPISVVVDGVRVNVSGIDGVVLSASAGDATQETTIFDPARKRTLSVIAVPFGTRPGIEDTLPLAHRGGAAQYRTALDEFRLRTGEFATDAPTIDLFGQRVDGDFSQRHEHVTTSEGRDFERDVFTAEWVAEAGPRLWIIREVQFEPTSEALTTVADFSAALRGVSVASDGTVGNPTTVKRDVARAGASSWLSAPAIKRPARYGDGCDSADYDRATFANDWRHALGAIFRGVPACGPRPGTGAPAIAAALGAPGAEVVQFGAAELSLRWMNLVFNTPPFAGNGDELLLNYDPANGGEPLFKYVNVPKYGILPMPGDVLSYETGGTGGHTAVVENVHVDRRGNGSLTVLEQDASVHGVGHLLVRNGEVLSNKGGPILGWLSPRPYR